MTKRQADNAEAGDPLTAHRLDILARGAPLTVASSIASILVLLIAFRNSDYFGPVALWGLTNAAVSLSGLRGLLRPIPPGSDPAQPLHVGRIFLALASLVWAAGLLGLSIIARGIEIPVIAIVGTAIFVGVLLIHRAVPFLAYFHIAMLTIALGAGAAMSLGFSSHPVQLLLAIYAATLVTAVARMERDLVETVRTETDREKAAETVRMLLNDYEEQSSDWLWTVDGEGRLRDIGERFGEACGRDPHELEATFLADLLVKDTAYDNLMTAFGKGETVRDLVVGVNAGDTTREWRISARPRADGSFSGVARDITADRRNQERVAFMAHYDNLTGLANRHLFNENLRESLLPTAEHGGNCALFYLDLDDFKAINDTRGHQVGDQLLKQVGERLKGEVRSNDMVARLGGDEFAVSMATRAGDSLLIERAHRFLAAIREPYTIDGQTYRISTSIGVARCADGECDAEEFMRRADLALYAAKSKGRDSFAMFETQLDRSARARREIEADLADALENNEFKLHYQPIVCLETGRVTALEALLRWHHPRRGLVSPANFLPVAETTGLIVPIGAWVIRQALHEMSMRASDLRLSINLSPTQVQDPGLLATVAQALHVSDIRPAQVEFEITEHVLMDARESNLVTLERLHEIGVGIALDDFGTGYSSLGYLRRFPFDRIKIDRHFIENVDTDADNRAIVSSVVQLAAALGMQTTAEGVERLEQLEALRKLGIGEAQGFYLGKPQPGDRVDLIAAEDAAANASHTGVVDYGLKRANARRNSRPAKA
ncbi:EAL domain-containing protein [Erythrobacter litoralis]|uniref:putative bifunctional diguanylate cyclase/phosphodiesterase n=1 Tax=Erythrobacter litoralis TaxID=39960 RepID=UPI0024360093|nr:EAL domain-containing protein [Erythrobacter litoralis]MDG6079233.1 EAL domain-containing protein [Erythrobacter litoralis]